MSETVSVERLRSGVVLVTLIQGLVVRMRGTAGKSDEQLIRDAWEMVAS